MKKIAVIGMGSAGVQTICHFLTYLNRDWQVVSIYDPTINILGIGESTNPSFIQMLQFGTNFHIINDAAALDSTQKFGTKYVNWREEDLDLPLLSGSVAIHFNTYKLKEFVLDRFPKIWGDKFQQLTGNVSNLYNDKNHAVVTVDNVDYEFDYVVDCRGFPKDYSGYTVLDGQPVNCAFVHNKPEPADYKFTIHKATADGWMFSVPLSTRASFGYLFNTKITSPEQAKINFSREIDVPVDQLDNIEYRFKSFYINHIVDGRICKNGNMAVFFEPMFANSLWLYEVINRAFYDYIQGLEKQTGDPRLLEEETREYFVNRAKQVEEMISFKYHGGSIYKTPFWDYAVKYSSEVLKNSENLKRSIHNAKVLNSQKNWDYPDHTLWVYPMYNLFQVHDKFGYTYFKD